MWVQYYDASSMVTAFSILLIPLLFVAFGLLMTKGIKNGLMTDKEGYEGYNLFFIRIWTGSALLITVGVTLISIKQYNQLLDIIDKKEYTEVEGFVENFSQETQSRIHTDSFTINNIRFGCGSPTGLGFGKAKSEGSPIYSGKYVKIHCFKGQIFKLWVREKEYSRWY